MLMCYILNRFKELNRLRLELYCLLYVSEVRVFEGDGLVVPSTLVDT
jgi:hypothetical protein